VLDLDRQSHTVGIAGGGQGEPFRGRGAAVSGGGRGALVADPVEPEHLADAERVDQGHEERRGDDTRVPGGPLRTVDPAIEQGDPVAPGGAPFPGDVAPDSPVVVVIGRHPLEPGAPARQADPAGGGSSEPGRHVARQKLVFPQLDRREPAVGPRLNDEIERQRCP